MRTLLLIFVLAIPAGCGKIPIPTIRAYHDAVGRGYERYVRVDTRLTDDEKRARLQAVESMERLLKEAEK